ncbi:MAG: hypothetical protein WCQ70_08990 [Lentimicrobiaceae bacterium]
MNHQLINDQYLRLAYAIRKSTDNFYHHLPEQDEAEGMIRKVITDAALYNNWFIAGHMIHALALLADDLEMLAAMEIPDTVPDKKVAVLHRTDAPVEGIAEILLMAKAGYHILVKPSNELMHLDRDIFSLVGLLTGLSEQITITENNIKGANAVISFTELGDTLKDYLGKYPASQLYQKGASLLIDGNESSDQLNKIAEMTCMYYGRAQQNIRVLFVPEDYDTDLLTPAFKQYADHLNHNRYFNNYEYRKSAMIINHIQYVENGPLLLTEQQSQAGFISVLCIQRYKNKEDIIHNKLLHLYPLSEQKGTGNSRPGLMLTNFNRNAGRLIEFMGMLNNTVLT